MTRWSSFSMDRILTRSPDGAPPPPADDNSAASPTIGSMFDVPIIATYQQMIEGLAMQTATSSLLNTLPASYQMIEGFAMQSSLLNTLPASYQQSAFTYPTTGLMDHFMPATVPHLSYPRLNVLLRSTVVLEEGIAWAIPTCEHHDDVLLSLADLNLIMRLHPIHPLSVIEEPTTTGNTIESWRLRAGTSANLSQLALFSSTHDEMMKCEWKKRHFKRIPLVTTIYNGRKLIVKYKRTNVHDVYYSHVLPTEISIN